MQNNIFWDVFEVLYVRFATLLLPLEYFILEHSVVRDAAPSQQGTQMFIAALSSCYYGMCYTYSLIHNLAGSHGCSQINS